MLFARIVAAVTLAAAPLAAGATTLVDGSFEAKGAALPVTQYCYDGFATADGPCAASPWVGGGIIHTGNGAWGSPTAPDGTYLAFVQSTQTLAQSFTATGTGMLHATWLDANRGNYGGIQSYTVTVGDGATTHLLGTYTSAIGGFVNRASANFATTAGTTYTFSFNGMATNDSTVFVDKVALVPEPAAWAMMLGGFGLVGFAVRRRGRRPSSPEKRTPAANHRRGRRRRVNFGCDLRGGRAIVRSRPVR